MNSTQRVRRAEQWLATVPADSRPDPVDVELVARLGVNDAGVMRRLLWKDVVSLARHFTALLIALESDGTAGGVDVQEQARRKGDPSRTPPADERLGAQGRTEAEPAPSAAPARAPEVEADPRRTALQAYVARERGRGSSFDFADDAWIESTLADPEGALGRLPVKIQRKHKSGLRRALGLLPGSADVRAVSVSDGDFQKQPDLLVDHQPSSTMQAREADDGTVELSWQTSSTGFAWFRVFAGHGGRRPNLMQDRAVGASADATTIDTEPLIEGQRQYAVWAYLGVDEEEAKAAAPVLWARTTVLQSVSGVKASVSGDDVSMTWSVGSEVSSVEIYRYLAHEERSMPGINPNHLVETGASNLSGFSDRDLAPGDYVYRIYACAEIDGRRLRSSPVVKRQPVVVAVPQVVELEVTANADRTEVIVAWREPEGATAEVEIHQTHQPPMEAARARELDESGLERAGFTDATRRSLPPQRMGDGRLSIQLDWPDDAHQVHFTAISNIGSSYRVGATDTALRVGDVHRIEVVERVDEQYLMFPWPPGADWVVVHQQPKGAIDPDPMNWEEISRLPRQRHDDRGGVHLERRLPSEGCRLAVHGLASFAGEQVRGNPVQVDYPGLIHIRYTLDDAAAVDAGDGGRRRRFFRKVEEQKASRTRLTMDAEGNDSIPVVLVSNKDRLPLHTGDGIRQRQGEWTGSPLVMDGLTRGAELVGYVRLFVDVPPSEQAGYAVLDPAIEQLKWS